MCIILFFFFKQKTAYEMRISDWSSDVCSSDLAADAGERIAQAGRHAGAEQRHQHDVFAGDLKLAGQNLDGVIAEIAVAIAPATDGTVAFSAGPGRVAAQCGAAHAVASLRTPRRTAVPIGRAACRGRVGQYV